VLAQAVPKTPPQKLPHLIIVQVIEALADVFLDGYHADKVIERRFRAHPKWGSRDRRLFAESVYDSIRWWRWYWHLAGLPAEEYLQKEALDATRLWQIWSVYWFEKHGSLPDWIECKDLNLDKVQRRRDRTAPPAVRASFPDWLHERGALELGADWPHALAMLNEPAPVFLRANTLKAAAGKVCHTLAEEGYESRPVGEELPDALVLTKRQNVFQTQAFKDGLFEVQDAGSQRIAPFLQVAPGMRVVDGCAGAGGKSLHLAALMKNKGRIVALDTIEWKLKELRKRAARAGADTIETRVIEGTQTIKRLRETADRVLLDVPCSGLGVIRRNPDAKWKLHEEELTRLTLLQADILERYSRMTRPGGKLVYATCSIFRSENEDQVRAFLQKHGDEWTLEEEFRLQPGDDGGDGFYAARLMRNAGAVKRSQHEESADEGGEAP
jgi:16S rRNA (cytosine967-C5)-methyltransferase